MLLGRVEAKLLSRLWWGDAQVSQMRRKDSNVTFLSRRLLANYVCKLRTYSSESLEARRRRDGRAAGARVGLAPA